MNALATHTHVRTDPWAVAALACGLLTFVLPAVIAGVVALQRIKQDPTLKGKGMALAGMAVGVVTSLLLVGTVVLLNRL